MTLRPTLCFIWMLVATVSCHRDQLTRRCDPFRTPRVLGPPVLKAEERSAHAPYLAGDCSACHTPHTPVFGESAEEARLPGRAFAPVNDNCLTCHRELFRAPPPNHPPELSFCTSCHNPHSSRARSLLLDDDRTRACLDYAPPSRDKPALSSRRRQAAAVPAR